MILLSAIDYEECMGAYNWHRGFAGAEDAIYPRDHDAFQDLVAHGSVWAAREASGDYLALAYAEYNPIKKECEIGGLMVDARARRKGLGSTMMRLALTHMLLEEDILAIPDARVVSHVLKGNQKPRRIIESDLKFRLIRSVEIPSESLPGLKADEDGIVRGDEYELVKPDSLHALAEWAGSWTGTLGSDDADIELRNGITMPTWSGALADLALRHSL